MPNHHPSRSWRGCVMCKPHKRRGAGCRTKDPVAVQRRLGVTRRHSRTRSAGNKSWRPMSRDLPAVLK